MLHDEGAGAGVLATGGEPLQAARQRQQQRGKQADAGVGRQQADQRGGAGHQQHGDRQHALAPDAVAEDAEDDAAQRTQGERHGEHREGLQQRQGRVARREEQRGDGHGEEAVDGEVEPLDEVADGRGGDHLVQGGRADLLTRVDGTHATLLIPDSNGFWQVTERWRV